MSKLNRCALLMGLGLCHCEPEPRIVETKVDTPSDAFPDDEDHGSNNDFEPNPDTEEDDDTPPEPSRFNRFLHAADAAIVDGEVVDATFDGEVYPGAVLLGLVDDAWKDLSDTNHACYILYEFTADQVQPYNGFSYVEGGWAGWILNNDVEYQLSGACDELNPNAEEFDVFESLTNDQIGFGFGQPTPDNAEAIADSYTNWSPQYISKFATTWVAVQAFSTDASFEYYGLSSAVAYPLTQTNGQYTIQSASSLDELADISGLEISDGFYSSVFFHRVVIFD